MSIPLDEDVGGCFMIGIPVEYLCSDCLVILEEEKPNDRNDHWQSEENDLEIADF